MHVAACWANRVDWRVIARIITHRMVEWALDSFAPYRRPGAEGIFPALLQEGREVLLPHLVRIFRASLATGYVKVSLRQVKVVFIP